MFFKFVVLLLLTLFVASTFGAQPIEPLVRVVLVTKNSVFWHVEDKTEYGQLPGSHFHVLCRPIKRKREQNDHGSETEDESNESEIEAMEQQNTTELIALWQRNAENVYTFGKLKPFTLYEFRIVAENDAGTSVPVIVMQETTDNWVPPTPFGQYVIALTSTVLALLISARKKCLRHRFSDFMFSFALGSLSGSATFHLLPKAFSVRNANFGLSLAVISTIYVSFFSANAIKILLKMRRNDEDTEDNEIDEQQENFHGTPIPLLAENNLSIIRRIWNNIFMWFGGLISNRQQPQKFDECDHSEQTEHDSTTETALWTIVNNMLDGFLIGSSAGAPLSCLSVSVALLCKRPKEMRPGKSNMKFVLHFLSALMCAAGFSSGLLIDLLLYDTVVKYGNACGSGLLIYISAVCMLPEMNVKIKEQLKVSAKKAFDMLSVQMFGVILGVFFAAATGFFQ
ncbi:hypothetical protein niasHT_022899 [Heterodera trifolii]|uniref:Fibronectin type-III domain-containing protein n=1 Tax=Heterodera trifolii TaxID=157864 RepID=A0ABD2KB30_9BILA